jgi:glucose-1-phosphate adenylyltransferase
MGIYLFDTRVLLEALEADNSLDGSSHDFGKDVLPLMISEGRKVSAFDFLDENRTDVRYWRDIGTLDAFYEANMDLVSITPVFNLYDEKWAIRSAQWPYPPAKFVFAEEGRRMGVGVNSMVCAGCIVSGGRVVNSILSPGVRVNSYSEVEFSILFPHVNIGRHSRIRRAIIDADLDIEEHTEIGFDPVADQRAGHFVTDSGIVIVHSGSPRAHSNRGNERQESFLSTLR